MDNQNLEEYYSYLEMCEALQVEPVSADSNWQAHQDSLERMADQHIEQTFN